MKCYNCGADLTGDNRCPNCGIDVKVYKKIVMASNYYYNQGLERSNVRDLSGAIDLRRVFGLIRRTFRQEISWDWYFLRPVRRYLPWVNG